MTMFINDELNISETASAVRFLSKMPIQGLCEIILYSITMRPR